jgi:hypothetical protein
MRTATAQEQESLDVLRETFPVGSTAYTILRHVARSGMTRWISVMQGNRNLSWHVANVIGEKVQERTGTFCLKVGGCGMDMGFHLVYSMSRSLYPGGHGCTGHDRTEGNSLRCPSNDHMNDYGQAQREYYDLNPDDRLYREDPGYLESHARMREYVDHRLATDLGYREDRWHSDGGYAVSQSWL